MRAGLSYAGALMKKPNKPNNMKHDAFYALLLRMPGADKEQIVWQYSNKLTTSLREFIQKDPTGYWRMISAMKQAAASTSADAPEMKRLRSAVLYRLQKHGVDTTSWDAVNRFLGQKRIAGKLLYEMSASELMALVPKLEMILRKDEKKGEELRRLVESN